MQLGSTKSTAPPPHRTLRVTGLSRQRYGTLAQAHKLHLSVCSVHICSSPYFHIKLDFIHHTISEWLLTLISVSRSFISRFILFTSRSNTVGVNDPQSRLLETDSIPLFHTIYGYLTGLLLALMSIKYQGSSTNPFSDHLTLITLFLIAIFVYAIVLTFRSIHMSDHSSNFVIGVRHISGALACELLLLVLVSPMRSLVINVSSLALIVLVLLCYKYLLHLFHTEGTAEQGS